MSDSTILFWETRLGVNVVIITHMNILDRELEWLDLRFEESATNSSLLPTLANAVVRLKGIQRCCNIESLLLILC